MAGLYVVGLATAEGRHSSVEVRAAGPIDAERQAEEWAAGVRPKFPLVETLGTRAIGPRGHGLARGGAVRAGRREVR